MGDAASNIGRAGHNQRHKQVLHRLVLCMQSCWGRLVEEEPQDHYGYSNDYRPDVTAPGLGRGGKRLVGDVKFKDPLSSNPESVERQAEAPLHDDAHCPRRHAELAPHGDGVQHVARVWLASRDEAHDI